MNETVRNVLLRERELAAADLLEMEQRLERAERMAVDLREEVARLGRVIAAFDEVLMDAAKVTP